MFILDRISPIFFSFELSPLVLMVLAPFAPFKASFKDPFKTRPPMGIRALSITNLNLVLLNVYKISIEPPKHQTYYV